MQGKKQEEHKIWNGKRNLACEPEIQHNCEDRHFHKHPSYAARKRGAPFRGNHLAVPCVNEIQRHKNHRSKQCHCEKYVIKLLHSRELTFRKVVPEQLNHL